MDMILTQCMTDQEKDQQRMLIVVDDCVGYMGKALEKLSSKYRHYGISLIVSSQQFRMIPPTVRTCAGYWVLFRTYNEKEVAKMDEEFSGQFGKFLQAYRRATEEKYHFLYIDVNNSRTHQDFKEEIPSHT
jgi:hypothetical protein